MTRSASSTYDDDFFAWTQEQAAALRRLSPDAIGNAIDLAHVAEEIEDLGKRDLREVASYLSRLFEHLIKIASAPNSRDRPHWFGEALHFQISASEAFSPSMRRAIDLARIWRLGRKRARNGLFRIGITVDMIEACPFALDELLAEDFDLDAALARVAAARATDAQP